MKSKVFFLLLIFIALLFGVENHTVPVTQRQLINHDDTLLVKPVLQSDLSNYFSNLLWNRNLYTYPLKDLIYMADQKMSDIVGFPTLWLTQFLLFLVYLYFAYLLLSLFCRNAHVLWGLWGITASHPLNLEVVLWLSGRKQILIMIFILWGSYLYLKWKNQIAAKTSLAKQPNNTLNAKQWISLIALWLASIACFPTGLIWFPLLVILEWKSLSLRLKGLLSLVAGVIVITYLKFAGSDSASYAPGLRDFLDPSNWDRVLFFTIASLGRGFLNFIFPIRLAPYYSEVSILNWIGLGLLTLTLAWSLKKHKGLKNLIKSTFPLNLWIPILLLPSAMVFLTYNEFVWADRYAFNILIFLLCLTVPFFEKFQPKNFLKIVVVIILFNLYLQYENSGKWVNADVLMSECAIHERSAKCVNSYLHKTVFQKSCQYNDPIIKIGEDIYQNNLFKYNIPFLVDMPFFSSVCTAVDTKLSPNEKIQKISQLFQTYKGMPNVAFGLILVHLQNNNLSAAFESAQQVYLGGQPGLSVSAGILGVFKGQAKALCERIPTQECLQRRSIFESMHSDVSYAPGYEQWGYKVSR